jgi:adenine deaminase
MQSASVCQKARVEHLIVNGTLVNVLTKEIYKADVAVQDGRIFAVGEATSSLNCAHTQLIDARGLFLVPGFIDQHIHIHHTKLNIMEFARIACPLGTTAVATDLYGEGVVGGKRAIRKILDLSKKIPLRLFYLLPVPGYFQNGKFGHNGNLNLTEMHEMLAWKECVGLSDTFATEVLRDAKLYELCKMTQAMGKRISGHGSELSDSQMNDWIRRIGETDDHECVSEEEMLSKLRLGIGVSMRLASGSEDLIKLAGIFSKHKNLEKRNITLNSDVISASDLLLKGYIDRSVRMIIQSGVPVIDAYQMATINTAQNLKVDRFYGSITPGRYADILFIGNLDRVDVRSVMFNGEIVYSKGEWQKTYPVPSFPQFFFRTIKIPATVNLNSLKIKWSSSSSVNARVILVSGDSYITEETVEEITVGEGALHCDVARDILYISSLERVRGTGEVGNGFVRGFGLKQGAIGLSKNSHMQNIVVVGTNHEDMWSVVQELKRIGGGCVAVCGRRVILLPLELFGLESSREARTVVKSYQRLLNEVKKMGCLLPSPFDTLSFTALPVIIGKLKICPQGLVDVWRNRRVDVVVKK